MVRRLRVSARDFRSIVLEVVSEKRMGWQVTGHSSTVYSCEIAPDGKHAFSGVSDTFVKIWNAETGAEVSGFHQSTTTTRNLWE